MKKFIAFLFVFQLLQTSVAQIEAVDNVHVKSGYLGLQSFQYKLTTTKYVTNENNYFLGLIYDTSYLNFKRGEDSFHYTLTRSRDEKVFIPVKGPDSFLRMPLEIIFNTDGKVQELGNWKIFRDLLMVGFSNQAKLNLITPTQFEDARVMYNSEPVIRRMVMEDITYLFSLFGDTFNTEIEYIRLKNIRSPFSQQDYYVQGSLKVEKPAGTKNTVVFKAVNAAGPKEKPLLLKEAQELMNQKVPPGEFASEVKAVGLNSEQTFQYNAAQNRMMNVTYADVVSMDKSSNAFIRSYEFWDMVE